ncbi:hypothetical protein HanPSC8_Chr11g0463731 [Helianthus annuus]|nr:hypothetical protein HanPSC8_Chr11g0463731 [Helianthus annuus]
MMFFWNLICVSLTVDFYNFFLLLFSLNSCCMSVQRSARIVTWVSRSDLEPSIKAAKVEFLAERYKVSMQHTLFNKWPTSHAPL